MRTQRQPDITYGKKRRIDFLIYTLIGSELGEWDLTIDIVSFGVLQNNNTATFNQHFDTYFCCLTEIEHP